MGNLRLQDGRVGTVGLVFAARGLFWRPTLSALAVFGDRWRRPFVLVCKDADFRDPPVHTPN